jgi:hypothetical protein
VHAGVLGGRRRPIDLELRGQGNGSRPVQLYGAGLEDDGLLLLLAGNYDLKTNDFIKQSQSAQRMHEDFLRRGFRCLHNYDLFDGCQLQG